jgi:hypothetical protein
LEQLTQEYVGWKSRPSAQLHGGNGSESQADHNKSEPQRDEDQAEPLVDYQYRVSIYDLKSLARTITILRNADSLSPALNLMRHGYLAKSPARPTVAVSINTLELLYRIRQRKPSFSIEAFAKVVCDHYNVCTTANCSSVC